MSLPTALDEFCSGGHWDLVGLKSTPLDPLTKALTSEACDTSLDDETVKGH